MIQRLRRILLPLTICLQSICMAQQPATEPTAAAQMRTEFHVRYINGSNVYIDGGRNAGLEEGTQLVLKQAPTGDAPASGDAALEPGILAKLTVVSIASTSAVCEVESTSRELTTKDVVSLTDNAVEKLVEKHTLGNTRVYPMVVSFSEGDPLDEEVREAVPHPPLPEVNQARGRLGFDMSFIRGMGQSTSSSGTYGMVVRADITRIFGTHWNLIGYWRGNLQTSSTPSQPTLQDLINRTYQISLTYVNPASNWTGGIGRLYLPWASSLEVIDGGYVGRKLTSNSIAGIFAGSTPDPAAWDYDPQRQIGGLFVNAHGGSFEAFRYSTTAGAGVDLLSWSLDRPFVFAENEFSYKRMFSFYHAIQFDKPTANPGSPAVNAGVGRSLLSVRVQLHPRVVVDLDHTYFRDVPTYSAALLGTGLLDQYLFQGINGGARIELPRHITGYFTLGTSNTSYDTSSSMNMLFGGSISNIRKTGIQLDAHYSRFNSAFADGSYRSVTLSRDLNERFRLNLQGGQQIYKSPVASDNRSWFINSLLDINLGSRYFLQSAFTSQFGGTVEYNQWTNTFGFRFDNRHPGRRSLHADQQ